MSEKKDTESVNAFSNELKASWTAGYENGFRDVPDGEELAKALNKFPLLRETYLIGYQMGQEDARNDGKWTDRGSTE